MLVYISSQFEMSSNSMFMVMIVSRIRMLRFKVMLMKLFMGDQIDELLNVCFKIMKLIFMMFEGVIDVILDVCLLIWVNDWMIELVKVGLLCSSQRKKLKNRMKWMNLVKNLLMLVLCSVMKLNVKISEIVFSVQNRNIVVFIIIVCQDVVCVVNFVIIWLSIF